MGLRTAAGDGFAVFFAAAAGACARGRGLGDRSHRPSVAENDNIHTFGDFHRGNLADEFQTVHDRHVDIAQDEVDYIALQRSQSFGPIGGFHDLFQFDARLTHRTLDDFAHHRGVIHDERSYLIHGFHQSAVYAASHEIACRYF